MQGDRREDEVSRVGLEVCSIETDTVKADSRGQQEGETTRSRCLITQLMGSSATQFFRCWLGFKTEFVHGGLPSRRVNGQLAHSALTTSTGGYDAI